jgi:Raf kinase inhibitor-like YbhB/YbcL family protein
MTGKLTVSVDNLPSGSSIPAQYCFCVPAEPGPVTLGPNRSPALAWSGAPAGTKSFAVICVDIDVPSKPDDVNKEGRTIPASLKRVDFYHWVLVDVLPTATGLPAGADSDGVTAGGKTPGPTPNGVRGVNNYTDWFAGDTDMKGDYGGYDGPCPPWNDGIVHHYHFKVFALDVVSLNLKGRFGGPEALAAMKGHVLAEGEWVGTCALNPALRKRA